MIGKSSENFKRWTENVTRWRIKYSVPDPGTMVFDPTRIVAVRRCAKCNSVRSKMSRHHKGHEYLFAVLLEDRFAARYILFHPDDVVWLCDRCHRRAHVIYSKLVGEVWEYVWECEAANKLPDYATLEGFRQKIVKTFNRWIAYKKRRKRRKRRGSNKSNHGRGKYGRASGE